MNDKKKPNRYIDHTLLKPDASREDIRTLCQEAVDQDFFSVCIHPCHLEEAGLFLKDSRVALCTVIGFPLGANTSQSKAFEAKDSVKRGAKEVDMVINIGRALEGDFAYVEADIRAVKEALAKDICLKTILETSYLSDHQIVKACQAAQAAGASFVKTSTGFSSSGASLHHVSLMRQTVGQAMGVKASGGIRDKKTMQAMIQAGASRIGASSGLAIMKEYQEEGN